MAGRPKRLGCEVPRLFTPPLRDLTPETSLGYSVIEFAADVLAITLLPWQQWLAIHALELLPDGSLRFRNVVVLVARQNGKSTLAQVLSLWWLYVCGCKMVLGTAQDLDTAEEVWAGAVDMAEGVEELADEIDTVSKVNGKKALILKSGERYQVKAANRKAGRGKSGDRILLDELREHQNWDSWGALTKDLADSTPMLTADGEWSTIGDLVVGDRVFSPSGEPVRVTKVVPIAERRPLYRVTATDGRSVIASESHLWTVCDTRRTYDMVDGWETLTTGEILARGLLRQGRSLAFRLPVQRELVGLPERDLPLDPYVLGCWLGDGTTADGTITAGTADLAATIELLDAAGASVTSAFETRPGTWRVRLNTAGEPLRVLLRRMGLLGCKRVPDEYLTASTGQRLALMQGLMDTDGCVTRRGYAKFTSTDEGLADAVMLLARSLGFQPRKVAWVPKIDGRPCSPAWDVHFRTFATGPVPFRLPRKVERCGAGNPRGQLCPSIASIEPVESEPSTCIAVDSADHLFLAGRDLMPTHNTTMARSDAQVWSLSNAGDVTSVVLSYLRKMAHRALGDPDGICGDIAAPTELDAEDAADEETGDIDVDDMTVDEDDLFLAEWSAAPGCAADDRDAWAQANPSMGYTITERAIASACRTDPDEVFRTEVLCQWIAGTLKSPFPAGAWDKTLNEVIEGPDGVASIRERDQLPPKVRVGLDMSHDRSRVYVAMAGKRADGLIQGEIVATRYGTEWVRDWLMERRHRIVSVTGQTLGAPVSALLDDLAKDPKFTIRVEPQRGGDLTGAFGIVHDLIRDGKVRHNPQPLLDLAAAGAVPKELGAGSVLDRRASNGDVSPLIAWVAAVWSATRPAPVVAPAALAPEVVAVESSPVSPGGSEIADMGF